MTSPTQTPDVELNLETALKSAVVSHHMLDHLGCGEGGQRAQRVRVEIEGLEPLVFDNATQVMTIPSAVKRVLNWVAMHVYLQRAQSPADVREADKETGWLIENTTIYGKPYWYMLDAVLEDGWAWTPDARQALRFSRKIDAEKFIADIGWNNAYATEHAWNMTNKPTTAGDK